MNKPPGYENKLQIDFLLEFLSENYGEMETLRPPCIKSIQNELIPFISRAASCDGKKLENSMIILFMTWDDIKRYVGCSGKEFKYLIKCAAVYFFPIAWADQFNAIFNKDNRDIAVKFINDDRITKCPRCYRYELDKSDDLCRRCDNQINHGAEEKRQFF